MSYLAITHEVVALLSVALLGVALVICDIPTVFFSTWISVYLSLYVSDSLHLKSVHPKVVIDLYAVYYVFHNVYEYKKNSGCFMSIGVFAKMSVYLDACMSFCRDVYLKCLSVFLPKCLFEMSVCLSA